MSTINSFVHEFSRSYYNIGHSTSKSLVRDHRPSIDDFAWPFELEQLLGHLLCCDKAALEVDVEQLFGRVSHSCSIRTITVYSSRIDILICRILNWSSSVRPGALEEDISGTVHDDHISQKHFRSATESQTLQSK